MSAVAPAKLSALSAVSDGWEALRAALRQITWPVVLVTLAVAAMLEAWVIFEVTFDGANPGDVLPLPPARSYVSGMIISLAMAFAIMFTTLVADELVARGAGRGVTYFCAVVIGSAAGALIQWGIHHALHLPTRYDAPGIAQDVAITQPAVVFFEYLIWGSIIVFMYVNRRTALRAATRMSYAQTAQAQARRRTLEARLQALQTRVEPQFLFNTLAQVRNLYDQDRARGGRLLEELIVYLRAALPALREPTSTLGRELTLVTAYLGIMSAHLGDRLTFDINAPAALADPEAIVPPMILLPLVDHVIASVDAGAGTGCRLSVSARTRSTRLEVQIVTVGGRPLAERDPGALPDIRARLRALYGELGTLTVEGTGALRSRVALEIPHESTDGDHR